VCAIGTHDDDECIDDDVVVVDDDRRNGNPVIRINASKSL
jgi:hypothetical protein